MKRTTSALYMIIAITLGFFCGCVEQLKVNDTEGFHSSAPENYTIFSTSFTASRIKAGHRSIATLCVFASAHCCESDRLYPSRSVQAMEA